MPVKNLLFFGLFCPFLPKKIEDGNRVKQLVIFTSVDTWGEQAEYIRHGLEFNRFWDNVNKIMSQCPRVIITFMSTYNALSLFNYNKLIKEVVCSRMNFLILKSIIKMYF